MKTVDISGMGGGYELCCQTMLLRGMAFLAQNPDFNFEGAYETYRGIYGVCFSETEQAKSLDEVITKNTDCTGAMHQAVIGNLMFIHKNGYQAWLNEFKDSPERIYEIDKETLEGELKIELALFSAKIAAGYDPLKDLKNIIPEDQWIEFDPDNPNEAVRKIVKIIYNIEDKDIN